MQHKDEWQDTLSSAHRKISYVITLFIFILHMGFNVIAFCSLPPHLIPCFIIHCFRFTYIV